MFSRPEITITVLDSNDSPPVFDNSPYKVSLSENAIAGHTVITVSASDPDIEGSLTYTLVNEKEDEKFRLDPLTGALYLSQPLDRETQDVHKIRIRADDGVQFSETTLTIEVIDSNDNSPVFDHSVYSFDIPEGTQRGAQAGLVSATDADIGVNKEISYSVLSDWGNNIFSLNPQTGIFTLTSHLDYEQMQHYIFVVQAQDSGTPSLSTTVTVYFNVVDLNDNAPLFDPMSYSDEVFENITVGTSILRVSATDMDSGDNGCIVYNIIDGNTDNKFAIDTDGTIFTVKTLDRETQSFYSLTVSATDRALEPDKRLSSTVQVSVILKDVNDMAPEFVTPNEISVMENVPSNTVVMAIKAIDKDEGRNSYIEYSLAPQSNSKFSLGPIDGLLRVVGPLDREQISEYKVSVVAKDRGHPSQSTMTDIIIQVTDENDNSPSFLHQQYSATVSENTSVGLSVLQVFASDVDEGLNGQVRYSIIAGDLNHDFVIDQDTGIIRVSKNLDYERKSHYSLTIQAEDSGVDIRHDTASVGIAITDINDNPPIFHDSPYYVHVMENMLSLPVSLMLIMAHDSDQIPNNQLQYLIKDGNRSIFSINPTTGELSVQKTLDREQQSEYILTISCIDSGSPRQTGTGTVKVIVDDINDNQPQFAFKEYSTYIMENLPPFSPVITISASDEDIGRNAQIQYSLLGNDENKFKVNPDTGTISTNAVLDREEHEIYNVLLVAQDLGLITQHKAVTNVTIIVEDENDNRPVFAESSYNVYTPDTAVGGHFVFGAVAVDLDAGLNSRLVYHLSGTDADKFQINQETGVVKLVQKLVNKSEGYQLKIHATDSGQTPLSSTTLVNVFTEKYQLFPRFHPGLRSFKFAESSENLVVSRVSAVSPKINDAGKLKYYIAGGNSGNAFTVNSEIGEVRLVGGLDRETISAYELWVEARDSDTPSLASAVKLEIQITDINDNSPVFEKSVYNATVKEELEPPLFVIQVQASDADFGVNGDVEYHFDSEDEMNNPFSLDLKTGKIYTTEVLDRETIDEYKIFIKAVDHGTPQRTSSATVYIKVLDKNDNPPRFTRLFSANVTENAPIGTFIIQVTSSDKDINMNANATYSFTENPGGKFNIDPVSGNVTVAGWIDREVKDEYLLKVAAVDGSWQAETPLTVLIQDVNDNVPEFSLPEYTFNIPELMQGVLFIGQVTATDRDKKGPDSFVSYSLKRPSDLFRIDPNTGNILSKQVLYYKRTLKGSSPENQHVLQVVATDHGNPPLSSEVTVVINVIDSNNNAPVFQKEYYFSPIPESAAIGLSVFQVVAEDKEDVGINAEIEYFKTGGNGSEYFSVHRTTGWVTVSSPLVGLKNKCFAINLKATDKGVPPRSADVIGMFSVTDENHYSPAFTALSYQVVIPENEPLLSEIVTVTATDEDKGFNGEIIYSILSGNHDNQFQISPHTGAITIAKYLDFESVSTYHLNILASDRGFQSKNSTAVLTVLVTDVNDNPPIFNSTKFDVFLEENEPPGTYVTQLIAFDADSARNSIIEYSVVEGDDHTFFSVNPKNGVVTSKYSFDYEQKTKYTIQIIASNVGTLLFTSTIVDIHIVGKNEYYPHFIQPVFQFTVSESAGVGTTVGQLQAVDEDSGVDGEVYFLLVGSSNNKGFQIDSKSGSIKVSRALDRESQSRVVLTVLAKNAGSIRGNDTDEAQIVISIQDGNDPPVFSKDVYEARVSEAAPLGTSVVSVSAVDKDVHPNNNQFSFSILSGNVDKAFSIDPQSGAIYTAGNLDRETHPVYNLTVTATDSGNPPQSGSTLVKIYLDDVNDNGPTFDASKVIGYVLENEPPYTNVMVLSVTDQDLPPNGAPFKFFLIGGEHKDFFEIETHTGLVKTTRSLDRETTPEYEILVAVQDSGTPPMSSQNLVKIMVLDKNDSPSTSRPLTILVWVHNKSFPGRKIADVHPQDLDIVGQYQCQIVEGNTAIFRIPRKCDLHTAKFENPGIYTLTVSGNDGKHRNVSSTIRVKFLNFDNATLQNSVSLRIWNFSADTFLAMHFDNFMRVLDNIFKSSSHPVVYSIVNVEEHLEVTLASKSSENTYVPPQEVLSLLNEKSSLLREAVEDKDIDIGYNPCEVSPCQNQGTCRSFIEMKDFLSIVDSPSLIFTSPHVAREFSCQCPPGFSGSMCQNQQDPCLPNPCFSGSSCHQDGTSFRCVCAPQYQGERCDIPRKESCTTSLCKNGGTCQEAPNSGFFCLCRPGFKGLVCEQTADACRPNRCLNGGTCVSENLGYHCVCTSSYFGRHCEKSSYGFHPYSYMAFNPLQPTTNDISIVFSTNKQNALLVYNFGAQSGGRSDFLSLEIINSAPTMSFGGSRTAITRISTNIVVSDGKWHKVTAIRNGKMSSVSVVHCNENGDTCEECLLGNSTCSKSASGHTGTLNFSGNLMFVGGITTVDPILERPGQVSTSDFVGCMRGLSVNGREIDMSNPIKSAFVTSTCGRKENSCTTSTCGESGTCINDWFTTSCICDNDMVATSCIEAKKPFSIGGGSFIELIPEEKHRRTLLLIDKVKETSSKTISFHIRSYSQNGIIMFSGTDDEHTLLQLIKGKLIYSSKMKSSDEVIEELDLPLINDGQWHKISLSNHQGKNHQLNISADNVLHAINSKQILHDFLDPYVPSITIGGQWDQLTGDGQFNDVSGCVKLIVVNNEVQQQNSSGYFKLYHHGNTNSMCQSEALGIDNVTTDPLSIGVILVIVFFVILLIVILISFLVFRRRKLKRDKGPSQIKQNGNNAFLTSASSESHRTHQCAGYTETANTDDVIRNHMPQDLVPKKIKDREHTDCPQRPDIIEREIHNKPSPALRIEEPPPHNQDKTQNNFVMQNPADLEAPEHYDLENASSIAPSDIDIVYHYKGFRDGNIHKYKSNPQVPSYHKHNHRHSPHQFQSNPPVRESPRNILHQPHNPLTQRDSPSSIKMQNTPLARLSPSSELSQQTPRILTLQDISGKPLQKALLATAQGVGSKQFQDPMTNSDRSLNSPVSNLSHSTSSMQSGHQNISKLKARDNSITLGLTTEEIERLNARPRNLSLVSTLDAVSSSSDDNAEKYKLAELLESNTELLEAQDSSTDESGNDSFTCSEFEYDNYDKVHREFGPRNMIFSKLAEEDNENDEDYAKNYDGFDSFRGSFSTLVASDDESSNPPPYKPTNGSMLGWDCLLNWGPNFENLVGVFKDIEQLPDNVNSSGPGHSQTDEDYV
ncbi:Cadherin-related tumor suppressor [Araneus ventricosus]|uniref:Cadherin-related tumor suppressor n=1 Tax=Araneus ventricosus TaxID=182803 RepID=A0A4Y2FUX5_ARAVE|nr:Cadherin-related tumor suppressor [Araneus ventricosus]